MKSLATVLTCFALCAGITSLFAQNSGDSPQSAPVTISVSRAAATGAEEVPNTDGLDIEFPGLGTKVAANLLVGYTLYDLQSNYSVGNRYFEDAGLFSAAWTQSLEPSPFDDRGTGYNFWDGFSWGALPANRLESQRVGWPAILKTAGGRVISIAHTGPETAELSMIYSDSGGPWIETLLPTFVPQGLLWPRACAGGADGNSIHMIALTTPIGNQEGTDLTWLGQDGALLYYRSLDQGDSWDVVDLQFPQMDASQFLNFTADSYAIHARGDQIAFAVFNVYADGFCMISNDNGDTWTYKSFFDFPYDLFQVDVDVYDPDNDGTADVIQSTDLSGAIHITPDGVTHVMFGNMLREDFIAGDGVFGFYPDSDGLNYWNDTFTENAFVQVASTADQDGDGTFNLLPDIPLYEVSLTGFPSMGSDASGNIYASYSGVVETRTTATQNYRHVFLMKSEDGGLTWTEPVDATPDNENIGYEAVYCSMSPDVNSFVEMIYQRDREPGGSIRGDLDPITLNEIINLAVTTDLVIETPDLAGCTNGFACNYNFQASIDDGSCVYPGCTDPVACNFELDAGCEDGSCQYSNVWCIPEEVDPELAQAPVLTCEIPVNYVVADQSCFNQVLASNPACLTLWDQACEDLYCSCAGNCGCIDPTACNFNPFADVSLDVCIIPGVCGCFVPIVDDDEDGILNCEETGLYLTDPNKADTDNDGLSDAAELFQTGTDPLLWDTDGDGCNDLLQSIFQCSGPITFNPLCPTDLTNDGVTNTSDFLEFIAQFGTSCP